MMIIFTENNPKQIFGENVTGFSFRVRGLHDNEFDALLHAKNNVDNEVYLSKLSDSHFTRFPESIPIDFTKDVYVKLQSVTFDSDNELKYGVTAILFQGLI